MIELIRGASLYHPLIWIEAFLVVIAVAVARAKPTLGDAHWARWEAAGLQLARRKVFAVFLVGALPLFVRAALLPVHPIPDAAIHDEFSNLLIADTLLAGRLANPPHSHWLHFDTFQTLQHPTYSSFRPPAPGFFLAAGKFFSGNAWFGVWAGMGLMCGAICWMLQGWFSPGWALLGGSLAAIQFGVFSYWMNSYWGGGATALGGALLLGTLPRIMRRPRALHAIVFAVGVALLLNSRPFEGALLCAATGSYLLVWMAGKGRALFPDVLRHFVLPVTVCLAVIGLWMLYYNRALTGSPWVWPYGLGYRIYNLAPPFVGQAPVPMHSFNHEVMRRHFEGFELATYLHWKQTPLVFSVFCNSLHLWSFFLRPSLTIPLLMLPWVLLDQRIRALVIALAVALLGMAVSVWYNPHYLAPITAALFGIVTQGLRHLRVWRPGGAPVGRQLTRLVPAVCAITFLLLVFADVLRVRPLWDYHGWAGAFPENRERAQILTNLQSKPGMHLVLVRYMPEHNPHMEWVFNEADIDGAKVVWAREMSPGQDAPMIEYFHDRHVWLLEPDSKPARLSPYNRQPSAKNKDES